MRLCMLRTTCIPALCTQHCTSRSIECCLKCIWLLERKHAIAVYGRINVSSRMLCFQLRIYSTVHIVPRKYNRFRGDSARSYSICEWNNINGWWRLTAVVRDREIGGMAHNFLKRKHCIWCVNCKFMLMLRVPRKWAINFLAIVCANICHHPFECFPIHAPSEFHNLILMWLLMVRDYHFIIDDDNDDGEKGTMGH